MTKLVLGTASWGQKDYGLKKDRPTLRMIKCILKRAQEYGIKFAHWKNEYAKEYDVPDTVTKLIDGFGISRVTPADFYKADQIQEYCTEYPSVSVMYNPLNQAAMNALHDYTGIVYVRSVWLQGFLASVRVDPPSYYQDILSDRRNKIHARAKEMGLTLAQYCLAGALYHPYVDFVIVGVNTVGELQAAINVEMMKKAIVFQPEHDQGEHDATDPRTWDVLRDSKPEVESSGVSRPDKRTTRKVGGKRQSRGRRKGN